MIRDECDALLTVGERQGSPVQDHPDRPAMGQDLPTALIERLNEIAASEIIMPAGRGAVRDAAALLARMQAKIREMDEGWNETCEDAKKLRDDAYRERAAKEAAEARVEALTVVLTELLDSAGAEPLVAQAAYYRARAALGSK